MRKLVSIVILVLIICFMPNNSLVRSEPLSDETPGKHEVPDSPAIIAFAVRSFSLYSSFLNDYVQKEDQMVPVHGSTRSKAQAYLNRGFTPEMTEAIIDECTQWDDSLGALTIVPCDGIPVLTGEDADKIQLYKETNKIILVRKYNNCYAEGDNYVFLVTMTPDGDAWKISELSFDAAE
ncbi:MAG: hypothetical protein ACM3PE_00190 [Deltaproteobacteria bacterium]